MLILGLLSVIIFVLIILIYLLINHFGGYPIMKYYHLE